MKIDFHTHFYTEAYLQAVKAGQSRAQWAEADGQRKLLVAGDYSLIVPGHDQPEVRLAAMAQHGIDQQLLSFSIPGLHIEEPAQGVKLARIVNDAFAEVVARYPKQFIALAALPLQDPRASVQELQRAVTQLGLRGAQLFSNVNGKPLSDSDFWPLYAKAEALDVPLFIHPISPPNVDAMRDFRLVSIAGFPFDTTLAALSLVFSGVLARFPALKLVLGNLGGTIPYLVGRADQAFLSYAESRSVITELPSIYLKRMYYETAGLPDPHALQLAIQFAGADHILLGSDYPQQIANVPLSLNQIESLAISASDKQKILGANAARLLRIDED